MCSHFSENETKIHDRPVRNTDAHHCKIAAHGTVGATDGQTDLGFTRGVTAITKFIYGRLHNRFCPQATVQSYRGNTTKSKTTRPSAAPATS